MTTSLIETHACRYFWRFVPGETSLPPDEGSWHGGVKSFELHVVNADDEVREAAALRHRAYTAMGYAIADSNGEFARPNSMPVRRPWC